MSWITKGIKDELKEFLKAWVRRLWVMLLNLFAWLKDLLGKRG